MLIDSVGADLLSPLPAGGVRDKCLDHESAARHEMPRHVAEAADLLVLYLEREAGVVRDKHEVEFALDSDVG